MSQPEVEYYAAYSDGGRYQVVCDPTARKTYLRTTEGGFIDVPYLVNGAEFVRYDFEYTPPKGLRGCDWATNMNRLHEYLALLTPPAKPATPTPQPKDVEDLRVHLEPGADPFRRLQEAGARAVAGYRANRERERQARQDTQPDPRKVAATMRINAEYAALRKPRGRGAFIAKGEQ